MPLTYSVYQKKVKNDLNSLPFEKLLFVGTWCSTYLDNQYGSYLDEIGHPAAHQVLQEAITFLWNAVDNPAAIDETVRKKHLKAVRNIDIENLDFANPKDSGILKIMEAVESTLSYAKEKDAEYILTTAYFPVDVLNAIKDGELDPYTTPPKYKIDDPFFKDEIEAQEKLLAYLHQHEKVSSADKNLFR